MQTLIQSDGSLGKYSLFYMFIKSILMFELAHFDKTTPSWMKES